jgi:hypothetical protein
MSVPYVDVDEGDRAGAGDRFGFGVGKLRIDMRGPIAARFFFGDGLA